MTEYVKSADGTRIAFEREGAGPPVILVGGAMQFRAFDPATAEMATALASHGFTVVNYDRRGRGESPADAPITLAQTIDDLRALIDELTEGADDAVALFGNSSGASIALAAAAAGLPVSKLVFFEIPLDAEEGHEGGVFLEELRERIAAGDREGTLEVYMADMPPEWLEQAKTSPSWPVMVRIGPSLEADSESRAWSQSAPHAELFGGIQAPALVLVGEETLDAMGPSADAIAAALPNAERRAIPAAQHQWQPEQMAETIAEFLDQHVERRPG